MPKSPAFIRIKSDVLKIVSSIPVGRVCTYRSIGEHLDVVPRHVAYILSQLNISEKAQYPWYRVVSDDGGFGTLKLGFDGRPQSELLQEEGFIVSTKAITISFEKYFIPAAKLKSGVKKQQRPVDCKKTNGSMSI
jgi:methylated-DNA-protein-cysteine methyltransferase related protein